MKKAGRARTASKTVRPTSGRAPQGTTAAPARRESETARDDSLQGLASRLGPGLITGAADDDPSGIATYSQAGAQFSFALVWTLFLTTPLMVGIQMLSARIGWATGEGLARNIDKLCPRWLTLTLVGLLRRRQHDQHRRRHRRDGRGAASSSSAARSRSTSLAFGALCIAMQVFFSYEQHGARS